MRGLRTGTVRAALSLVHRKPGNCALTRAAAWTSVLPGPARDHHGPEDPVEEAGHRDDQDQDAGDGLGELRHRHRREPRGGNEFECTGIGQQIKQHRREGACKVSFKLNTDFVTI